MMMMIYFHAESSPLPGRRPSVDVSPSIKEEVPAVVAVVAVTNLY